MKFIFLILTLIPISSQANELSRCMELFQIKNIPKITASISALDQWSPPSPGDNYLAALEFWSAEVQAATGLTKHPDHLNVILQSQSIAATAGLGEISLYQFGELGKNNNDPVADFRWAGKATYMHEYTHLLIVKNIDQYSAKFEGYSELWDQAEIVFGEAKKLEQQIEDLRMSFEYMLGFDSAHQEMTVLNERHAALAPAANKINEIIAIILPITTPYEEVLADLAAVLGSRDFSIMEKSVQLITLNAANRRDTYLRDFSAIYDADSWFNHDPHTLFSPVRSYLKTVVEKYGWEQSPFIFNAALKAAAKRIESEMTTPEEREYLPQERNKLFIEAIKQALNESPEP